MNPLDSYQKYDDAELVLLIKKGDIKAFNAIYYRYIPKVLSFLKGFYTTDYQSEEIVQEIFVSIWEKRERLDENLSFPAYVFKAARNRIYNSYRAKVKQLAFNDSFHYQADKGRNSTEEYISHKELQEHLDDLINELPPVQKKVFLMSRNNGLTNEEIAQRLNLSRRTVEHHIYRALKYFKQSNLVNEMYLLAFIVIS